MILTSFCQTKKNRFFENCEKHDFFENIDIYLNLNLNE